MQVVECEQCGLMYLSPRPTNSVIESWYGSGYFSGDGERAGRGYLNYFAEDALGDLLSVARQRIEIISRNFSLKGAKVLEIGCATGETCEAVSEEGARVFGCDLSGNVIQVARRRYPHVEFQIASTEHLPFATATFDAVLAFELIEHVPSPSAFIREVGRVLRPGGLLALTTPNVECGRRTGWSQWTGFLTSFEHLYFFDSKSLARLLSRGSISIEAVYGQGQGRVGRSRTAALKAILRRLRLFRTAKVLYRAVTGSRTESWIPSDVLHTLMMVTRKA